MNVFQYLTYAYPDADVEPMDFVNALHIGADGWVGNWLTIALAVIFGLLVYIFPIIIMETEHVGPYPLWLHCFYCAADFMGIWVFIHAWNITDHFLLFLLLAIGEAVWVAMEIFCLQRAVTFEADINFEKGASMKKKLTTVVVETLGFYLGLNMLRFEWHDSTMWKFWIFTQVLITTIPVFEMKKRGYKSGNALILNITFICVALVSFNPWANMWLVIKPEFFSFSANPWYYLMGLYCLVVAIYGVYLYKKLPAKEDIMGCGKKPALK